MLPRTHTRVALCPVSRTQLGWVSAFNPLGGARSLSRKACIHLRPRKAVGFVSGCNRLRTTTDQAGTDGRTGLTAADYHLGQPTVPQPPCNLLLAPLLSPSPASWTCPCYSYIGFKTNILLENSANISTFAISLSVDSRLLLGGSRCSFDLF